MGWYPGKLLRGITGRTSLQELKPEDIVLLIYGIACRNALRSIDLMLTDIAAEYRYRRGQPLPDRVYSLYRKISNDIFNMEYDFDKMIYELKGMYPPTFISKIEQELDRFKDDVFSKINKALFDIAREEIKEIKKLLGMTT
jgi:hypothetical protein